MLVNGSYVSMATYFAVTQSTIDPALKRSCLIHKSNILVIINHHSHFRPATIEEVSHSYPPFPTTVPSFNLAPSVQPAPHLATPRYSHKALLGPSPLILFLSREQSSLVCAWRFNIEPQHMEITVREDTMSRTLITSELLTIQLRHAMLDQTSIDL